MFHVKHSTVKGRGAQSGQVSTRFGLATREVDGDWRDYVETLDGPPVKLRTTVTEERPKSILTFNQSPDVPFDRSINAYRGCEHVMFSRIERRLPEADGVAPHKESDSMQSYNMCLDDSF